MTHLIVGGAGIGGLTAAIALAQIGVDVTILERRSELGEVGAGLQLAPNASRILASLGALDTLRPHATEVEAIRIRRGRDAAELSTLRLGAAAARRYGAPFLVIHRADLQRALLEHLGSRAEIRLETAIVDCKPDGPSLSIAARSRGADETLTTDGFVDARGLHAIARGAGKPGTDRRIAWRSLVPMEAAAAHFAKPETCLWLGPRTHLVHYPLRGGSCVNVVAITEDDGRQHNGGDLWSESGDPAQLLHAFRDWHREATTLLRSAPAWRRWPLSDDTSGAPWSVGRTTRLGDVAHPMLPFLAQGAGQAIEDAAALAEALRQASTVPDGFSRYEAKRRGRATRVQRASRRQGDIYHLSRPASDARDFAMRLIGGPRALAGFDWLYDAPPSTKG